MRQLKHHEKKLLKKVDFLKWKNEDNLRELQVRAGARPCCLAPTAAPSPPHRLAAPRPP
jgi:hypothetical protein